MGLSVSGSRRIRPLQGVFEVGVDFSWLMGRLRGRGGGLGITLEQLLPPQFRLPRTVPTPTRHVEEEEGMASGLPTAWFRVSRGFFEFLSAHSDLGTRVGARRGDATLREIAPRPQGTSGKGLAEWRRPCWLEEPQAVYLSKGVVSVDFRF